AGATEHAGAHRGVGPRGRGGEREVVDHGGERLDIGPARDASLLEVRPQRGGAVGIERAEGVQRDVVGEAAPGIAQRASSGTAASAARRRVIASRMRVLTVPSGSSSSTAISAWLRPRKYARSITWCCSCGSSIIA